VKIGILIWVLYTVGLTVGAIIAIKYGLFRNPFKDKWGRWKDDISRKEQIIWNFLIISSGMLLANILRVLIFN
jgi:hypothetical protein